MDVLPLKDFNLIMKTENPAKKITLQWSILNINKLPGLIVSPKFALASGQPRDWDVSIRCESDRTFQFSLAYHAQDPILVTSHSRILKNKGSVLERNYQSTHLFNAGDQHPLFTRVKFTDQEDDKLVFQCSMTVHGYGLVCSRDLYRAIPCDDVGSDYLSMLTSKEFTDVKVNIGNRCFPVHSCLLKHLAPKFFSNHQYEILEGKFSLMGTTPDVFEAVLQSIYSGKVNLTPIAMDWVPFYWVASHYELKRLLRESIEEIVCSMEAGNVCEIYRTAEWKKDEKLVKYCLAFMKDNLQELESRVDYLRLSDSRPHLPRTILQE